MESKIKKILTINGSIISDSISWKTNLKLIEKIKKNNPEAEVQIIDLNNTELAKTIISANNFANFWENVNSDYYIDLLKSVDLLVINTPMINFSYSILVKNFIDAIAVANKTFSYKYSKKGDAIGLLNNLKVIIVASQGAPLGWYPFANHISNLEGIFNFLGVREIKSLLIDGTKVAPRNTLSHEEIINEFENKIDELISQI
ncbi:FMN-dependent NADH-azoreductase [Mycoplasma sp. 744]|uniref:FMN-dependent NADH-azoreductase n=1 Tax=Mycoplasma sp. 744 TaxID=3108531 RepID=UPI002B1D2A29|nr:FMN-dependent NADH-azoreductase [Mycoplasma sp. 744]MEA4115544.1 FMN-dependent NADH-azoreductase [Mycoplasma sp. 744]